MATLVIMPQLGESITEGTVVRWLKKIGDPVERDEPLCEISTDKVDAEIPSPTAGVLNEIRITVGQTVPVQTVLGVIGPIAGDRIDGADHDGMERPPSSSPYSSRPVPDLSVGTAHIRTSPVVRRMAREHGIDVAHVKGSGTRGRIIKRDMLAYLDQCRPAVSAARAGSAIVQQGEPPIGSAARAETRPHDRLHAVPMTMMRRTIAEHMVLSRRTSAHVHSVFHVSFSAVSKIRKARMAEFERAGVKLTFLAFIAKAVVDALPHHPLVNSSLEGDNIIYKRDVHLGIAVALDDGLIVPVIKDAGAKGLMGLSRAIADLANRARARQLKPEEIQGGTFTITNPGMFGDQFALPIINQPQVAILGVGAIEKHPVVVHDAIAIRMMAYLTLGFDHRLVDGVVADKFMADVKSRIENVATPAN